MGNRPTFAQAIALGFKNTLRFKGVARRSEYWYYVLFYYLVQMVLTTFDALIAAFMHADLPVASADILGIILALPLVSLVVRRFRDAGFWPWLVLTEVVIVLLALSVFFLAVNDPGLQMILQWIKSDIEPSDAQIEDAMGQIDVNVLAAAGGVLLLALAWGLFRFIVTLMPTKTRPHGNKYAENASID